MSASKNKRYWDSVPSEFNSSGDMQLWREHSDRVYRQLFDQTLGRRPVQRGLKTDLFDEAVSAGLFPYLASFTQEVHGIDVSVAAKELAEQKYPDLHAHCADVRELPFDSAHFDYAVSNSTLDHFQQSADIGRSLQELYRVLKPGGELVVSLDNLLNPLILVRNLMPWTLLNRLGIVPYYVGKTLTPKGLKRQLERIGFEILQMQPILHCPRVLAVRHCRALAGQSSPETANAYLDRLFDYERLSHWPSATLSGHYIAAHARRPLE